MQNLFTGEIHQPTRPECKPSIYDFLNPIAFTARHGTVQHPIRGVIPFILADHQKDLLSSYYENNRNVVLHARQTGVTTTTMFYALWYTFYYKNRNIFLIGDKLDRSKDMFERFRYSYHALPDSIKSQVPCVVDTSTHMEFANGMKIYAIAPTRDSARGHTIDLLILDGFGFIPPRKQEEFLSSVMPALAGNCYAEIIMMTSGGNTRLDNMFNDFWDNVEEKRFTKTRIEWHNVIDDSPCFKEDMISNIGQEQWEAEYECKFYD